MIKRLRQNPLARRRSESALKMNSSIIIILKLHPGSSLDQSFGQGDRMVDIQNLIPNVLENLAEIGCDETFIEFLNQVNNGEFPLQNISFLLWMEVVKWFSCDNTCRIAVFRRDQEILETWLQSIWREVRPFYGRV